MTRITRVSRSSLARHALSELSMRRLQRFRRVALLLGALLSYSGFAFAEPDIERARRLFEEASTLREAGHFADALVRLRLAIAIKDTPGLEYHAGFCEAKLGHYVNAIEHYERAASLIRAGAAAPDVVALLNEAHKAALEHVGRVRVRFPKPVSGAVLRIDDQPEQPLTTREILLDPGRHRLQVHAPGHTSERHDVTINAAEDLQLDLSITRVESERARPTPPPSSGSAWRTASIGTALGVTALGLTTGVVGAIGHGNASSSEQAARAGGPTQSARLAAAQEDKRTYATMETVGFVTAGVGALATVALWTLWPNSKAVSVTATQANERGLAWGLLLTSGF